VHETKHLSVCKTGAPVLVPADVLMQNRCVCFRKSILLYNRANNFFADDFKHFMKSSVALFGFLYPLEDIISIYLFFLRAKY